MNETHWQTLLELTLALTGLLYLLWALFFLPFFFGRTLRRLWNPSLPQKRAWTWTKTVVFSFLMAAFHVPPVSLFFSEESIPRSLALVILGAWCIAFMQIRSGYRNP